MLKTNNLTYKKCEKRVIEQILMGNCLTNKQQKNREKISRRKYSVYFPSSSNGV